MSHLVGNPEDQFSHDAAQIGEIWHYRLKKTSKLSVRTKPFLGNTLCSDAKYTKLGLVCAAVHFGQYLLYMP